MPGWILRNNSAICMRTSLLMHIWNAHTLRYTLFTPLGNGDDVEMRALRT